jgi:beta-glucosidase
MPEGAYYTEANILAAIAAGKATAADIGERCGRILRGWFALDADKRHPCGGGVCINANVSTPAHKALARELAAKSTVLLKNDGALLPLAKTLKLALIGKDAVQPYTAGTGSGGVSTNAVVSPFAALQAAGVSVVYEPGATAAAAAAAAATADVAIVFGHAASGEGSDRVDLTLSGNIDAIIPAVAMANNKTIVYLAVPGSIRTDWRAAVPAILAIFLCVGARAGARSRHPWPIGARALLTPTVLPPRARASSQPRRAGRPRARRHPLRRRAAAGQASRHVPYRGE